MIVHKADYSATDWAREHGTHFSYRAALDNFEPMPRSEAYGTCHQYSNETVTDAFILEGRDQFNENTKAVYLLDDGATVQILYVAAWHPDEDYLILHPFPTNFNADGTPKLRADRDEQVDHSTWMHGPRRCYHLKIKAV